MQEVSYVNLILLLYMQDPYELNNIVHDPAYTEVKLDLRKRLLAWIKEAENATPEIVD